MIEKISEIKTNLENLLSLIENEVLEQRKEINDLTMRVQQMEDFILSEQKIAIKIDEKESEDEMENEDVQEGIGVITLEKIERIREAEEVKSNETKDDTTDTNDTEYTKMAERAGGAKSGKEVENTEMAEETEGISDTDGEDVEDKEMTEDVSDTEDTEDIIMELLDKEESMVITVTERVEPEKDLNPFSLSLESEEVTLFEVIDLKEDDSRKSIIGDLFSLSSTLGDTPKRGNPAWMDDMPGDMVDSITDAILLNDRIIFVRELFEDDDEQFLLTVSRLDEMQSLTEGVTYLRAAFPSWNESADSVYRFYMVVRRKLRA